MRIQQIIVCGAGTMGSGIAQVAAQQGHETYLYDKAPQAQQTAQQRILSAWKTMVDKQRMTRQELDEASARLHLVDNPSSVTADLIIEAVVERLDVKIELFRSLSASCHASTILASNTSSLSISALQDALPKPERIAGMHFFNPAPVMKLVEIVSGPGTSAEVTQALEALALGWGKVPVLCRDAPGFIVNRVARPYYLEALRMVEEGAGEFAAIDRIAEATGFKMGPFRLMDLIGNDINLEVSRSLYEAYQHAPRFKPSSIQEATVARGDLGRKTGKGYYTYP